MKVVLKPCNACVFGNKKFHIHKRLEHNLHPAIGGHRTFDPDLMIVVYRCELGIEQNEELSDWREQIKAHGTLEIKCPHYEKYKPIKTRGEMEMHRACAINDKESLLYEG